MFESDPASAPDMNSITPTIFRVWYILIINILNQEIHILIIFLLMRLLAKAIKT